MKKILEHIHSKPTHHRRRISLQLAAGITAVVFIAWIVTLPLRLSQTPPSLADKQGSSLVAGVAAAGSELKNQFGNIKSQLQVIQGNSSAQTETQTQTQAQTLPQTDVITTSAPATTFSGEPLQQ